LGAYEAGLLRRARHLYNVILAASEASLDGQCESNDMDKVHQVFVSSTFADLKEERRQVSNVLAKAGYVVAGMELFPATDEEQLEYIRRVIDRSDYYVVIIGGRYGSSADQATSFTEKEYDYARKRGIPVLAFLHENPRKIAVEKTDEDPAKAELLEQFRKKLSTGRLVKFWNNPNDLCTEVVIAVTNEVNLKPGVGWVRGDQTIDPKVLQESERLRIENEGLRKELAALDAEGLLFDKTILGPDDKLEIGAQIKSSYNDTNPAKVTLQSTFGELFLALYDQLVEEPAEFSVKDALSELLSGSLEPSVVAGKSVSIDPTDFLRIRNQFEALGLIRLFNIRHKRDYHPNMAFSGGEYSALHWQIAEKGRNFAIRNRALRHSS
jgi:hypothetical protein